MRFMPAVVACVFAVILPSVSTAEPLQYGDARKQRWQIGMIVEAPAACTGILAAVPVPMDWPEQQVQIVDQELTSHVAWVRYRVLAGGVKQMLISIPQLRAGDAAQALVTFEVHKRNISGPADTTGFRAPAESTAELARHLGVSPLIETTHPDIERLAAEIVADTTGAWAQAEAIFDWVRANVRYEFDEDLKGALTALKSGHGDCEELTSLFVALCRARKIPARSVWVEGHCYPEFYLEQADGSGCWFPCQAAGAREFGGMHEPLPILQKGDNFLPPGERKAKRYAAETFQAKNAAADPRIQFIRKLVPD